MSPCLLESPKLHQLSAAYAPLGQPWNTALASCQPDAEASAHHPNVVSILYNKVSLCPLHMSQLLPEFGAFAILSAVCEENSTWACVANIVIQASRASYLEKAVTPCLRECLEQCNCRMAQTCLPLPPPKQRMHLRELMQYAQMSAHLHPC